MITVNLINAALRDELRKQRHKAAVKRFHLRHPDAQKISSAKYRAAHLEQCRKKVNEARQRWRIANPEKNAAINKAWKVRRREYSRAYERQRKTGVTPEQANAALVAQNHCCKICAVALDEKMLGFVHADHSHSTGQFRGMLCRLCNNGLGCFKDNPEVLAKAMKYLKEN